LGDIYHQELGGEEKCTIMKRASVVIIKNYPKLLSKIN
jgi:hypothetical protein